MARNVEIKARVTDPAALTALAKAISDHDGILLHQEDIYYDVPRGRLKLRVLSADAGELIYYERSDTPSPKESEYHIAKTDAPSVLNETLSRALGVKGRVRKQRRLYMIGQTRLHIDDVAGLGHFMELEVVLKDNQSVEHGREVAEQLLAKLKITKDDLIGKAYIDLLSCT